MMSDINAWNKAFDVLDKVDTSGQPGRRAPVQGGWDGDRDREPGTIAWSEHLEAWAGYDKRYKGQSAERIAQRGGFGHSELRQFLGHAPQTFTSRRTRAASIEQTEANRG